MRTTKAKEFFLTKALAVFFMAATLTLGSGCKNQEGMTLEKVGVFLPLDESYKEKGLVVQQIGNSMTHFPCAMITFSDETEIDRILSEADKKWNSLSEEADQDAFLNQLYADLGVHQKLLAQIMVIPNDEYKELLDPENENSEIIAGFSMLGKKYGSTYLYDIPESDSEGMGEDESARFEECKSAVEKAVKKARLIKIEDEPDLESIEASGTDFEDSNAQDDSDYEKPSDDGELSFIPDFESVDLDGNKVGREIFSRKKITVVNVWGTFCGPCIQEMPELAAWAKDMDKDAQIIGIVCDVTSQKDSGGIEEAKSIIGDAGADFTNILALGDVADFISGLQYVPTTFLVDSNGRVVSEMIVGAQVEKYKSALTDWLEENR